MKKRHLLTCLLLLLLAACAPGVGSEPDAVATQGAVFIRVLNSSDVPFDLVNIVYPNTAVRFEDVPPGSASTYQSVSEAYQLGNIDLRAEGQTYSFENLDSPDRTGEPPITAGYYTITIALNGDNIIADTQPDVDQDARLITAVTDALTANGLPVSVEPSIQRGTVFDQLYGSTISQRIIMQIAEQRVDVFTFADETAAQAMAATIQPGGSSLTYTRDDGQTVTEFMQTGVGNTPRWWRYQNFILNYNGQEKQLIDQISTALNTQPLNSQQAAADGDVQIRVSNLGRVDMDSVIINFVNEDVDYGALPVGQTSGYQTANGAYHYAWVRVTAVGQEADIQPIDFVGETPLPPGQYTYALSFDPDSQTLTQTVINDADLWTDETLIGKKWYWAGAKLNNDDTLIWPDAPTADTQDGSILWPHITFDTSQSPNEGEAGYLFGGYTSCNGMGGTYFATPYQTLVIPGIGQEEAGCEGPVGESEAFFTSSLRGINYYQTFGDFLYLWGNGRSLLLSTYEPASAPPYAQNEPLSLTPLLLKLFPQGAEPLVEQLPDSAVADATGWQLPIFEDVIEVYVFDDTAVSSDALPGQQWVDGRFLIHYGGDQEFINRFFDQIVP